ncbi:MAG: hypothetical protein M3P40_01095 [Actinomycetota bacterium]|nr:hypothetical protein [Actinomycetota bacterium]
MEVAVAGAPNASIRVARVTLSRSEAGYALEWALVHVHPRPPGSQLPGRKVRTASKPVHPVPGIALDDIERMAAQIRGGARDPRGAIPMPASLAPGADDADRHTAPLRGWEHVPRVISSAAGLGA